MPYLLGENLCFGHWQIMPVGVPSASTYHCLIRQEHLYLQAPLRLRVRHWQILPVGVQLTSVYHFQQQASDEFLF